MKLNRYTLIPIFLNLAVLIMLPTLAREQGLVKAVLIGILVLAWPWIMAAVVGRQVDAAARRIAEEQKKREDEDPDFV